MFSVAPLVKLMFCFLQWLGALLCHGEKKASIEKYADALLFFFIYLTQNSITTLTEPLAVVYQKISHAELHLKHFCCHLLIILFIFYLAVYQKMLVCINTLHLFMFYTDFSILYMLDAS